MDRTPNRTVIVAPANRPRASEPRNGGRRNGGNPPPPPPGKRRRSNGPQQPDPRRTLLIFVAGVGAAFGGSFALTLRLTNPQLPSVPLLQTQQFSEKPFPGKPLADLELAHGPVDLQQSTPPAASQPTPEPLATMPVMPEPTLEPTPEPSVTPSPQLPPEPSPQATPEPSAPAPSPAQ